MDVVRRADWLVDVGPLAGEHGGRVLHSGPPEGLAQVPESATRRFLFPEDGRDTAPAVSRAPRPGGSGSPAWSGTMCAASTRRSRSGCSRR